tara:strand:+ start:33 stop:509 length:477 start_codon:yes stop_codon:yes gene_type:complete
MLKQAKRLTMNVLGFGVVLVLLSACSSPRVLQITTTPIAKPELTLPDVDVIKTKPVEFFIITPENYAKVFAKIKKSGRPIALFALTDKGYENLGTNLSSVRALIEQQKTIIAAYESYYKESKNAINSANKQIKETEDKVNEENSQPKPGLIDSLKSFF